MKFKNKAKMMREAERALKRKATYQKERGYGNDENYALEMVLYKGDLNDPEDVLVYGMSDQESFWFHLTGDDQKEVAIPPMEIGYDDNLFKDLEDGYAIAGMSMEGHYGVWYTLDDIENTEFSQTSRTEGLAKYLLYCRQNGVTAEKLRKETGYEGRDMLKLYEKPIRQVEKSQKIKKRHGQVR
ncbi:hypothetical protein LI142_22240 [Eubacterium limosum]|uniref:Uncharacterized protein n=1 Tax=Eubacterium limosum TaxID=1736 RepID=A0ABT5UV37_EUBLI|nr:hypothetical protein [Eubacterium limosum]MCB6572218.1 hypothetical protein [Eubacterium limosum]MDE1472844.1 hypothetical protein [Eubacterium limosum]